MGSIARLFLIIGSINMAMVVTLGAFGAHGLKTHLEAAGRLATWETAVRYHSWHALGLLIVGLIAIHLPSSSGLKWAGWLILAGIVLFSGSLYVLCLSGITWLGAITPIGGVAFIVGWALLAVAVFRSAS